MARGRVRTAQPPGSRSCGASCSSKWIYARTKATGSAPFIGDVEFLKSRFPSDESRLLFMEHMRELMRLAAGGRLPWDLAVQMQVAPDVLELKLPDWHYSGGLMHARLYYSEPRALPGQLVALRLLTKRPGPIGLPDQDQAARDSSDLLLEFENRGFR